MTKNTYKTLKPQELSDNICVVVGTRPGIIKMSPLIKELEKQEHPYFIVHTGQHYSFNMDAQFFHDLELPKPRYHIDDGCRCSFHGEQTAKMIVGCEKAFLTEKPKCILVCGDANTNLAAALAARKLNIKIGHVEAGLRSRDWRMPEEHNRVMIDHISEYLFAPTEECVNNLKDEKVMGEVILCGNTIVETTLIHSRLALKTSNILKDMRLEADEYLLFTSHREENVDNPENMKLLLQIVRNILSTYDKKIVFPAHPRTLKNLKNTKLLDEIGAIENLLLIEPVGYLDFLMLLSNAKAVVTDSGGIQEESCILKVPCVTIRDNTERPETLKVGANKLAGLSPEKVIDALDQSFQTSRDWENPFGNGNTAKLIIDKVTELPQSVD